jgi:phosphoglucomutase/phosphomannomutase
MAMRLDDVTAGLRCLAVGERYCEQAIRYLVAWWEGPQYAVFRPQLENLAERGKWDLLLDSFYRVMPFGTGGRRGPVGIGPNRINHQTVITSVQGHVNYLRRRFRTGSLRIVVAFDVRVFRDLRGLYDPAVPNPLLGLSSRDLARLATAIYAANGVEVHTVPGDGDYYLSTPELSFAIRHLRAHGGLNISASHNHPDDNGAKFHMPSGGQPVPPDDEDLAKEVEAVTSVPAADFDEALRAGRVHWWEAPLHARYLEASLSRSIDPSARRALIAYTPLHGTGLHTVGDVLPQAGFEMRLVERQAHPDGAFPEVKFRVPNPEVPESMELVSAEPRQHDADAGFAPDPDADRLGVVAPADGAWRFLTGNEIAVLLAAYIIETRRALGTLPAHGFVIKTAVTTELLTRIARAHGVQMLGDLLVGFKYVGQALDGIAAEGRFRNLRGTPDDPFEGAKYVCTRHAGRLPARGGGEQRGAGECRVARQGCSRRGLAARRTLRPPPAAAEDPGRVPHRHLPPLRLRCERRLLAGHGRHRGAGVAGAHDGPPAHRPAGGAGGPWVAAHPGLLERGCVRNHPLRDRPQLSKLRAARL